MHRDIKPRNILVNRYSKLFPSFLIVAAHLRSNCDLKLADFGLARIYDDTTDRRTVAMTGMRTV